MAGIRGLYKGTSFEVTLSLYFKDVEGIFCLPNVRVYSPFLKKPTEIDRMLITPWNVYLIELKSFSSALLGKVDNDDWTGVTGRTSTKIYSPVMQNYEHIRSLKNAIFKQTGKFMHFENYVVIPDSCRNETDSPNVSNLTNFFNKVWLDSVGDSRINSVEFLKTLRKVLA